MRFSARQKIDKMFFLNYKTFRTHIKNKLFMEKANILLSVLMLIWLGSRYLQAYFSQRQLAKYHQKMQAHKEQRSSYFFAERKKVMAHYRQQVINHKLSVYEALKDTAKLLAFNSGGEDSWKQEFSAFKKEMQQYL